MRRTFWSSGNTYSLQRPWKSSQNISLQLSSLPHKAEHRIQVFFRRILRGFTINILEYLSFTRKITKLSTEPCFLMLDTWRPWSCLTGIVWVGWQISYPATSVLHSDLLTSVFHDVDLLPEDDRNLYSCPDQGGIHTDINILNFTFRHRYWQFSVFLLWYVLYCVSRPPAPTPVRQHGQVQIQTSIWK